MSARKHLRIADRRRGAAALEFAVITPVILLFALAAADYGRVVHVYTVVSNAARSGAEYGGMHGFTPATKPSWEARLRQTALDEMRGLPALNESDLQVEIETTADADGVTRVAVTARYPFGTAVSWPGLPAVTSLAHRVEMRRVQ